MQGCVWHVILYILISFNKSDSSDATHNAHSHISALKIHDFESPASDESSGLYKSDSLLVNDIEDILFLNTLAHKLSHHKSNNKTQEFVKTKKSTKNKALFGSFAYKGMTLSLAKSVLDSRGVGIGFKVPITPNFPVYDSKIYLPRVTAFVGVGYPVSAKVSVSVTVQVKAIIYGLRLLQRLRNKSALKLGPLKPAKSTDSIQRVGFNINFKLDPRKGFSPTIGPVVAYLPSYRTVQTILPFLLAVPVVLLTGCNLLVVLLETVLRLVLQRTKPSTSALKREEWPTDSLTQVDYHGLEPPEGQQALIARNLQSLCELVGLSDSWRAVQRWMAHKKASCQWNLGDYWSSLDSHSPSSNLVLDLQPFFLAARPDTATGDSETAKQKVCESDSTVKNS